MPSVSQAQNRYWHWVDSDPSAPADKKKVAKEFLSADQGRSIKKLPEKKAAPVFGALDA